MSTCNIDHSKQDVENKLESQKSFLPSDLYVRTEAFLQTELTQETLNELFHLLKKYDLITNEEQQERNQKMIDLMK
ncbi:group-specific protein [Bacillus timonensis]|nr:group-specific protein [Bacillus timonensis]